MDPFRHYLEILLKWNRKVDLVAPAPMEVWLVRHMLDCLPLAQMMTGGGLAIDVGSGAGLPGLVLKMVNPDLEVTLVEPTKRKVAFLRNAIRELSLSGIVAMDKRVEELPPGLSFKHVVSRATFPYAKWLRVGRELLSPDDGTLYAMLGPNNPEGLQEVEGSLGLSISDIHAFTLPDSSSRRILRFKRSVGDA